MLLCWAVFAVSQMLSVSSMAVITHSEAQDNHFPSSAQQLTLTGDSDGVESVILLLPLERWPVRH